MLSVFFSAFTNSLCSLFSLCLPVACPLRSPYAPTPVFSLLPALPPFIQPFASHWLVETITLGGRLIKGFYAPQEIHSETTDSFYLEKRRGFSCSSPSFSSSLLLSYNHPSYLLSAFILLFVFFYGFLHFDYLLASYYASIFFFIVRRFSYTFLYISLMARAGCNLLSSCLLLYIFSSTPHLAVTLSMSLSSNLIGLCGEVVTKVVL